MNKCLICIIFRSVISLLMLFFHFQDPVPDHMNPWESLNIQFTSSFERSFWVCMLRKRMSDAPWAATAPNRRAPRMITRINIVWKNLFMARGLVFLLQIYDFLHLHKRAFTAPKNILFHNWRQDIQPTTMCPPTSDTEPIPVVDADFLDAFKIQNLYASWSARQGSLLRALQLFPFPG